MPDGEYTEITIRVTMRSRWVPVFLAMLKRMQVLGAQGSSRTLAFFSDGDGDFRPRFNWDPKLPSGHEPIEITNPIGQTTFFDAG